MLLFDGLSVRTDYSMGSTVLACFFLGLCKEFALILCYKTFIFIFNYFIELIIFYFSCSSCADSNYLYCYYIFCWHSAMSWGKFSSLTSNSLFYYYSSFYSLTFWFCYLSRSFSVFSLILLYPAMAFWEFAIYCSVVTILTLGSRSSQKERISRI